MRARVTGLVLVAAVVCVACERQVAAPETTSTLTASVTSGPQYETIDLGDLGSGSAEPAAIGSNGTIVGTLNFLSSGGGSHGFIYEHGSMRELPYSGRGDNQAHAIGNGGRIAGAEQFSGHTLLVWDSPDVLPRRLDTGFPQYGNTRVLGMNDRGDILANVDSDAGRGRALLWQGDVAVDLGGLERPPITATARWTFARAWNARGQIVGSSRASIAIPNLDVFRPFIWENGVMRDLGSLGSSFCEMSPTIDCAWGDAFDINARGTVVGLVTGPRQLTVAFVWEDGVMRELGAYPSSQPSRAFAINDRGQILGVGPEGFFLWDAGPVQIIEGRDIFISFFGEQGEVIGQMTGDDDLRHAFIWQSGVMTDLGLGSARAINERGEIIGAQEVRSPEGFTGSRAVLWRRTNAN